MYLYRVAGLTVDSEVGLPGLIAAAQDQDEPDVRIRRRPVPRRLDNPDSSAPTWDMKGETLLLRIPGVARFHLEDGREIAYEAENGTPVQELAIFLAGTVFGILLHQRRNVVLHASAIKVNDKAVLFCGASGSGKSTLAAALVSRGHALISDDLCAINFANMVRVQPDGRQLKLWAQAIDELGLTENRGMAVRAKLEKYYVQPRAAFGDAVPLGAVYALREAIPPFVAGIEQPHAAEAALILTCNAYRPLLVSRMKQQAEYFRSVMKIVNAAGLFRLTRPLDFGGIPKVLSCLERHWCEIGLTERAG